MHTFLSLYFVSLLRIQMQRPTAERLMCFTLANQEFRKCAQNQSSIKPIPCDAIHFLTFATCVKENQSHKKDPKK